MSNDEEHAPSAAASENEDDEAEADSDREQPTRSRKRSKTSLTKVEDLYAVSQRRQALSAKANKGKFAGLRAEKPARANAAPTTKHPEDMSPQSMSAQDVSEALPPHGFGIPYLYPNRVYDDSQDEGYDSV